MESSSRTALDLDLLLAQTDWVQGLARRLVADEERARDVAQDAFLAALERPPVRAGNEKSLRAWLARVVRSMVHVGTRSDVRRKVRESLAARPPQSDSAADTVARASQLQLVVDTVMEIEEPYRAALLMTYFDGLNTTEVAARTGATEVAVRKRVSRGLQRLREKLDRMHGGDRNAWVSAFLPWLSWEPPIAAPIGADGSSGLAIGTKVAAALLAAGVGAFVIDGVTIDAEVPIVASAPADSVGLRTGSARVALAPPFERFAEVEAPHTSGWLNVLADGDQPVEWRLEDNGLLLRSAPASAGPVTFPVAIDRTLDLVAVVPGDRQVIALEPFVAGEVRDVIVSLTSEPQTPEVARAPSETETRPDEQRESSPAVRGPAVRLARYLGTVERGSSERVQRRYVASARAAASKGTALGKASAEGSTGLWASLTSGAVGQTNSAHGEPVPHAMGSAHGLGGGWSTTHSFQGGLGTSWAAAGSQLAPGGSIGSIGLFSLSTSSGEDDSQNLMVIDGSTGWPALAVSAAIVPNSSGGLSLIAMTADGRVGAAPLLDDGPLPLVVVRTPRSLSGVTKAAGSAVRSLALEDGGEGSESVPSFGFGTSELR